MAVIAPVASSHDWHASVKNKLKQTIKAEDQLTSCLKVPEFALKWATVFGAQAEAVSNTSTHLTLTRYAIALISLPVKIWDVVAEGVKQLDLLNKVSRTASAVAACVFSGFFSILNKLAALGNACCDSLTLLASKTVRAINLTAVQAAAASIANMAFLAFSSIYGTAEEVVKFCKNRVVCMDNANPVEKKSEAKAGMMHSMLRIAMWVSYLALAAIVIVAISTGATFAPWITLACSTSALIFTLAAFFYKKHNNLSDEGVAKVVAATPKDETPKA